MTSDTGLEINMQILSSHSTSRHSIRYRARAAAPQRIDRRKELVRAARARLTSKDLRLEATIRRAYRKIILQEHPELRKLAWRAMVALISQRSPRQVRYLELRRGLRHD